MHFTAPLWQIFNKRKEKESSFVCCLDEVVAVLSINIYSIHARNASASRIVVVMVV